MADYMSLHASAYPPTSWTFLATRQLNPQQTFNNKLWTEMTNQYEQSMERRQHMMTCNSLSQTATKDNIARMDQDTLEQYHRRSVIAFEDGADVEEVLDIAKEFVKRVDKLARNPMKTILEEDEFGATHSRRQPTEEESLRIKEAILKTKNYEKLQNSHKIERSFRARLMDIYSTCHKFICTPVGNRHRPRWAQICRVDKEVANHVARVQQQMTSDVPKLRDFLRGLLFDEYCLMKGNPMEDKDKTWLEYGKCLMLGQRKGKDERSLTKVTAEILNPGDPKLGARLDRMIEESGLDPDWVMDHIEDYFNGNDYIGTWQRWVKAGRWMDLAAKFTNDIQQLEKINRALDSNNSRRCKIMLNIQSTKGQFFKRLNGASDFELSKKASRMDEGYESSSSSSSGESESMFS